MRRYSLVLFVIATAWMLGGHPVSARQVKCEDCFQKAVEAERAKRELEYQEKKFEETRKAYEPLKAEQDARQQQLTALQSYPGGTDSVSYKYAKQQFDDAAKELGPKAFAHTISESLVQGARARLRKALDALNACKAACPPRTPAEPPAEPPKPPAASLFELPPLDPINPLDFWQQCIPTNECPPVGDDPFLPGFFPGNGPLPPDFVNLGGPAPWITAGNIKINLSGQFKAADALDPLDFPELMPELGKELYHPGLIIPPTPPPPPPPPNDMVRWFNRLGLLARLSDRVEGWRANMGPRPLVRSRDVEVIDRATNSQAAGLPNGVHVLLTDQGGSTGKTLVMSVLNLTGKPVRLIAKPFAIEPIAQQSQQQVLQAFNRLSKAAPVRLSLSAYCINFAKAPPGANTLFRLAPADAQQKFAPMSKILQSSYRVVKANALHPDSNPAAYADSIKQWSLWTVEQNFNEKRFAEAFVAYTRKHVEAAGQKWSKPAEDTIRKASPNRWRNIVKILQGAGVPVPQ